MVMEALTVSTLAGWLTFAVILSGLVLWVRGGGPAAISSLEAANRVLKDESERQQKEIAALRAEIATLRASRDFTLAFEPFVQRVTEHADRVEKVLDQLLLVIPALLPPAALPPSYDEAA